MAKFEQIVATLQNQVTVQAQQIAKLRQIIAVNSSGVVTIQAPGTLNINAGGNLNMSGSTIDINAAIAGVHGILKADTMMTTTVIAKSYTPGAGNIWEPSRFMAWNIDLPWDQLHFDQMTHFANCLWRPPAI